MSRYLPALVATALVSMGAGAGPAVGPPGEGLPILRPLADGVEPRDCVGWDALVAWAAEPAGAVPQGEALDQLLAVSRCKRLRSEIDDADLVDRLSPTVAALSAHLSTTDRRHAQADAVAAWSLGLDLQDQGALLATGLGNRFAELGSATLLRMTAEGALDPQTTVLVQFQASRDPAFERSLGREAERARQAVRQDSVGACRGQTVARRRLALLDARFADLAAAAALPLAQRRDRLMAVTPALASAADDPIVAEHTPSIGPLLDRIERQRAEGRALVIAAAASAWQLAQQGCPARLDLLVPDLLSELPQDPVTRGPFAWDPLACHISSGHADGLDPVDIWIPSSSPAP